MGGALSGTFWATIAPVGAEIVGLRDLPGALSITWVVIVPPTTLAEVIALGLRRTGSSDVYLDAQIFVAMMYLGGALCLWIVRGWKVGQLEELDRHLEPDLPGEKKVQDGALLSEAVTIDSLMTGGWR
jgi:hypothetical protein